MTACSFWVDLPGALSKANTDRLPAFAKHLCPSLLEGGAGIYLKPRSGLLHEQVWDKGAAILLYCAAESCQT